MKIAIGTTSAIKIKAVKEVIPIVWADAEFFPVEVSSGVGPQPMTDEDGMRGATNRARNAMRAVQEAKYGIGLEGAVQENSNGMFISGWVVILDRDGNMGIGSSGRAMLPVQVAKKLRDGGELGPIIRNMAKDNEDRIRKELGTIGVLTDGLTDRTEEFREAIKLALARFISPKMYIE